MNMNMTVKTENWEGKQVKKKEGSPSQRKLHINGNNKAWKEEQKGGRGTGVVKRKQKFIVTSCWMKSLIMAKR